MDENIGHVTSVVTRAFMNSMVPIATVRRTNERKNLTPMVVSGTHSLDMSFWLMEGKYPRSVFAQSVDKKLQSHGTKDSTFGIFTMDDDTIFSMNISWALPTVWPGSVYGLEIGIVGTEGVIDIEDTHSCLLERAPPRKKSIRNASVLRRRSSLPSSSGQAIFGCGITLL